MQSDAERELCEDIPQPPVKGPDGRTDELIFQFFILSKITCYVYSGFSLFSVQAMKKGHTCTYIFLERPADRGLSVDDYGLVSSSS